MLTENVELLIVEAFKLGYFTLLQICSDRSGRGDMTLPSLLQWRGPKQLCRSWFSHESNRDVDNAVSAQSKQ